MIRADLNKSGVMDGTVLLFVDDPFFLKSMCHSLKHLKTSVITAGNRQEALELCSNYEVDLALLDVRQQGHEAMQVLARLKKSQPDTEVILLSDPDHVAEAMEGMRHGAYEDITVPFELNSFIKKIQSALRRRKARRTMGRHESVLDMFENTMVAATFAQAGEFETAREINRDRCTGHRRNTSTRKRV